MVREEDSRQRAGKIQSDLPAWILPRSGLRSTCPPACQDLLRVYSEQKEPSCSLEYREGDDPGTRYIGLPGLMMPTRIPKVLRTYMVPGGRSPIYSGRGARLTVDALVKVHRFTKSAAALEAYACGFLVMLGFAAFIPELAFGLKIVDGDLYRQVVPVMAWYGRTIRAGGDFLWSPDMLGGFPIAFSQYAFFFPVDRVLAASMSPDRAVALSLAIHLPLAGTATYSYGRCIGLARLPSLLAGVAYELCLESLSLSIGGYLLRSLFLLPALLLSAELIARKGVSWMLFAAVAVGLSLLSGTAYVVTIIGLNAAIYVVARGVLLWRSGQRARMASLLAAMCGSLALGVGIAAIRVLPTLVVTGASVRSNGLPLSAAAEGSTSLGTMITGYLIPLTGIESFPGGDPPGYVGPAVLAFAGGALCCRKGGFLTGVFAGLLCFNLLAFLGSNAPLFPVLHSTPLFEHFRTPSRFTTAAAFFLAMLAAQGLQAEAEWLKNYMFRRVTRVSLVLTVCALSVILILGVLWSYGAGLDPGIRRFAEERGLGAVHPLRPRILVSLVAVPGTALLLHLRAAGRLGNTALKVVAVGGTAALLLGLGVNMLQFRTPDLLPPATARFLQTDLSQFRVMSFWPSISYYNYLSYFSQGDPRRDERETPRGREFRYRFMRETLAPNFALEFGVEAIDGFEVLQSTRQAVAMGYLGSDKAEEVFSEPGVSTPGLTYNWTDRVLLLRAFNVKYILTNLELWQHSDAYRLAFTSPISMLNPETVTNVYVYEVLNALPRAYLVPDHVLVGSEAEALDRIMSGSLDPAKAVALEEPLELSGPQLDPAASSVDQVSYNNSRVNLVVRTTGSGFLVINDAYYPGWSAWVDGLPAPILVANGWIRAIPIEAAGLHTVQLTYEPPLFREGLIISLGSLLVLVLGLVATFLRRRIWTRM